MEKQNDQKDIESDLKQNQHRGLWNDYKGMQKAKEAWPTTLKRQNKKWHNESEFGAGIDEV